MDDDGSWTVAERISGDGGRWLVLDGGGEGGGQGRTHPPASMGTSPSSASTFFVASPTITRTSRVSCGFWCKFRRKHDFAKDLGSQVNVIPSWVIISLGF